MKKNTNQITFFQPGSDVRSGHLSWRRGWDGANLRRKGAQLMARLHDTSRPSASPRECTVLGTRHLEARQVMRLTKDAGVCRIQVREGVIWLTSSPAEGDTLLKAGEQISLDSGWPVVFEALKDARVELSA